MTISVVIRSGGQSGVDRAALDCAIANGIRYEGWCPRGGWAEDFPTPPGLLTTYAQLTETRSADPSVRTRWNVRDSDATLILTAEGPARSPGTRFTLRCAEELERPHHVLDLSREAAHIDAVRWLVEKMASVERRPFVLNVAGPRESQSRGVYAAAAAAIERLLRDAAVM